MADPSLKFSDASREELVELLAQSNALLARARRVIEGQAKQIAVLQGQAEQVKVLAGRFAELEGSSPVEWSTRFVILRVSGA
ncbi:hypothetical protein ACFVVC_04455 [Pseudarthrobacter sp. NPDC058196]|uniref:hypothetical protein n=1 Tax=Pseudarthrobacter sp. NPDC058196 TaxID=3346376 RepID=UPI0036DBA77E